VVPANEIHPRALPPNAYVVRSGDSLWKLAAARFGDGTGWTCVAEANPQLQDANRIQVGRVLTLPTSCRK
jgi:5'-nucleotidase/UDP-sugar diphosphatase